MRVALQIAKRYLFGKKNTNAINYITGISVVGIAIGTAALILILSVFNGFETLTKKYLDSFNPDIKITPKSAKYFEPGLEKLKAVESIEGLGMFSQVIEEVAHFEYNSRQLIGIIKGVDEKYLDVTDLNNAITNGVASIQKERDLFQAIIGAGVYRNLNIALNSQFQTLKISVPNRKKKGILDRDFRSRPLDAAGVFSVRSERDNQYVIADYNFISALLDLRDKISAIEVKIQSAVVEEQVIAELETIFDPDEFMIQNRLQQDASVLKIMNVEKWSSYLIFSFTLILIIFNVIGCLWMIVLDKKKDIAVLQSYGATKQMIKNIFLFEGVLISILGFTIGLICSLVFYFFQTTIGIITVPEGFDIVNYPMEMIHSDVLIVFLTVVLLGVLASIPAAFRASGVTAYVRME